MGRGVLVVSLDRAGPLQPGRQLRPTADCLVSYWRLVLDQRISAQELSATGVSSRWSWVLAGRPQLTTGWSAAFGSGLGAPRPEAEIGVSKDRRNDDGSAQ